MGRSLWISQKGPEVWGGGVEHSGSRLSAPEPHHPAARSLAARQTLLTSTTAPSQLCFWSSHRLSLCPRAGVRHSGAALALLFHEVKFPTLPPHGAASAGGGGGAGAGLPRPERAPLSLNLTGGKRPLPRPLPSGHTIVLPRANRGCSRPFTACHRGGEGGDSPPGPGRGTDPRRWPGSPGLLPGCAPPSSDLPARHGGAPPAGAGLWWRGCEAGHAARRSGCSPSEPRRAAETPPRPGPAAARAPWAWAGAAAPGDSGQPPPGPAHTFPIKGKKY